MWTRGQVGALVVHLRLADQLLVDLDFFGQAQVVRDADDEDAVDHRLVLFVAEVGVVLVLVGVGEDDQVGVDEGEARGLDGLLPGDGVQLVQEALFGLEHLDELDDAAVGDVQFAVEVVGARVGLGAVLGQGLDVDATR